MTTLLQQARLSANHGEGRREAALEDDSTVGGEEMGED
jgi:hypothetical protein